LAPQPLVGPGLLHKKLCPFVSLSRAAVFQFLTPSVFVSSFTPSSHRSFGLPTVLTLSSFVLNTFLRVLSLFIRTTCPAHGNLFTLMQFTMYDSLNVSHNSQLYLFRHTPFFYFCSKDTSKHLPFKQNYIFDNF
jgi:hypothetical protein